MNRAVVVLLLLIANALVTVSKTTAPSHPAAPLPSQNSLGLFRTLDGTTLKTPRCDAPPLLRTSFMREDLPCVRRGLNL